MSGNYTTRLHHEIASVCPIQGVSIGVAGQPSSVVISFDLVATEEQRQSAVQVVNSFQWSDPAQAAWELSQARTAALTAFVARQDDTAIAVRLLIDAVCTLANDKFEALGQGRPLTLDKIMTYVQNNPTAGDPL